MRAFWFTAGLISLAIGLVGIVLPLVPTVPLILLAAFCFSRSSERLHHWLIHHPTFGPSIADWQSHGAIHRRGKRFATVSIMAVFTISLVFGLATHILIIQAITLSLVLLFIWTRPDS